MPLNVNLMAVVGLAAILGAFHEALVGPATIDLGYSPLRVLDLSESHLPSRITATLAGDSKWSNPENHLHNAKPLLEGELIGPETVVAGPDGSLYFMESGSGRVTWAPHGNLSAHEVYADVGGAPLGAAVDPHGNLVYCDAAKGLMMVEAGTRRAVLLTDRVSGASALHPGSHIFFPDDAAVAKDGTVFFTDACEVAPAFSKVDNKFNVMEASARSLLQGPSGRLLAYYPRTKETHVLADGIYFANGVALSEDEHFLVVAATYSGRLEPFVDLVGAPDGVASGARGTFWVAMPSPLPWSFMAAARSRRARWLVGMLPRNMHPAPARVGMLAQISNQGRVLRYMLDSEGRTINMLTSVNEHNHKLYLGNLHEKCAFVYNL